MSKPHYAIRIPTGDPLLDLLAATWAAAFRQAVDCHEARAEIVAFFGIERVRELHRHGLIPWGHDSALQTALEAL